MRVLTLTLNPALDLTVRADHFRQGAVNAGQDMRQDAGGKGVNVASILADAGAQVTVTGLLGAQNAGAFEALFRAKGIQDAFVRVPGLTRVGVKIVDEAGQETTDINMPGLAATDVALTELHQHLLDLAEGQDAVVLAGSLPPQVPLDFYATLTAQLRARGLFVALDTSGPALNAALGADVLPNLLKPNVHELEGALGAELNGEADVLEAARRLIARGAQLVAVSMGEQGALLVTATATVQARPPRVSVKSTVGAGDAMVAGLVYSRLRGLSLNEAARTATSFSVGTITRLGAHLPGQDELDRIAARVEVRPLQGERAQPTA